MFNSTVYNIKRDHRDSGYSVYHKVDQLDARSHLEVPDAKPVVACGAASTGENINNHYFKGSPKRAASEMDCDEPDSPKPKRNARQNKKRPASTDDKARVGCPFFKKDPKSHGHQMSCHGIGFPDVAKLKDHLKEIHVITPEFCKNQLDFRANPFKSLKTLESKWNLVFQRLFPEVPKDDIPSPYPNEAWSEPSPSSSPPNDLGALKSIIKHSILDHYSLDLSIGFMLLDFETSIDDVIQRAIDNWQNGQGSTTADDSAERQRKLERTAITLTADLERLEQDTTGNSQASDPTFDSQSTSLPGWTSTDTKICNGLPSSPQIEPVMLNEATSSEVLQEAQNSNALAVAEHSALQLPDEPKPASFCSFNQSVVGMWTWTFVPSSMSPPEDMPSMIKPVDAKTLDGTLDRVAGYLAPCAEASAIQLPTPATTPSLSPYMGAEDLDEDVLEGCRQDDREGVPSLEFSFVSFGFSENVDMGLLPEFVWYSES